MHVLHLVSGQVELPSNHCLKEKKIRISTHKKQDTTKTRFVAPQSRKNAQSRTEERNWLFCGGFHNNGNVESQQYGYRAYQQPQQPILK